MRTITMHDSDLARSLALQLEEIESLEVATAEEDIYPYLAVGPFGIVVGLGIGAVAIT